MSFLTKLWDKIKGLLSKIWEILKVIVAVALIIAAVYFLWIGAYLYAAICFAGAFLVDEETAQKVVDGVAGAVTSVAEAVAEVAASAINTVASSLLKGPVGWVLLAVGAYFLLSGDDSEPNSETRLVLGGGANGD